nr:ribonuclease H-like domain-containing protein [Tanacetum cinerariifolium]
MADHLANLREKVSDKNLVMYALNGLDTRYKGIAQLIRHSQPLPKFETAHNMLLLEESNLQEATDQDNTYDSSSSSPTVLMATKTDTKGTHTKTQPLPQICNHFNKGSCKFGDRARLVANGSSQQLGIDCDETFSPVVKPATIRIVLSLAVSRKWPIHHLDVKNAFLNGDLSKTVYMHQPPGFVDLRYPHHVCLLQKSLYGLKQEPLAWFLRFAGYATHVGFYHSRCDSSLFILHQGSQKQYAIELLARAHMTNCNPSRTPVDTNSKLGPEDISYAFQQICLYMHNPREPYLATLKRILRYIRGTLDFRFHLYSSTTISLIGYTDADWAGCPSTRRSTSGYCVFLGDNLLSWSSKRQQTISRSSAEAEYLGVANVVAETAWLRNLLRELHSPLSAATLVYCDNVSATYLLIQFNINGPNILRLTYILFVTWLLLVKFEFSMCPPAISMQIFTNGLPSALFKDFRSSLSVLLPPAPTAGEY